MSQLRSAFTMVEILVVVSIMALVVGAVFVFPRGERRQAEVRASAELLASTLREARAMAIRQRAVFAVVFNIQNGRGTSGRVVNNWDGQHWFQIQGPGRLAAYSMGSNGAPIVPWPNLNSDDPINLATAVKELDSAWYGDRRNLPARKARILAIGDTDNGGMMWWSHWNSAYRTFKATYPRPWFGWYDSGRLYPWGGYDSAIAGSGFGYQGSDPAIVNCANPATRVATHDANLTLLQKDAVRPLIDGRFSDFRFLFMPDGSVQLCDPFLLKCKSYEARGSYGGSGTSFGDLGDLYLQTSEIYGYGRLGTEMSTMHAIATHEAASGYWYVTIAPDVEADTDAFPNAQSALATLRPTMRVGLNRAGDVRVVQVSATAPALAYDTTITNWLDTTLVKDRYNDNLLRAADKITIGGRPIVDRLTPEMLKNRYMWTVLP